MKLNFKKSSLLLITLSVNAVLFNSAFAASGIAPPPGGWSLGIEGLDVRATQFDDSQRINFVTPSYNFGYGLSASYGICNSYNDIAFSWLHVGTGTDSNNGLINSTANSKDILGQTEKYRFDEGIADIGHTYHAPDIDTRIAVGLQYANVEFDNSSTEINTSAEGGTFITTTTNTKDTRFHGIGPHVAATSSYNLWDSGFRIVGNLGVGLLVGNTTSDAAIATKSTFNGVNVGPFTGSSSSDANVIIPDLEAKLGLSYTYQFCGARRVNCSNTVAVVPTSAFTVEGGWKVWDYFDALRVSHDAFVVVPPATSSPTVTTNSRNFAMQGLYVDLRYSFA